MKNLTGPDQQRNFAKIYALGITALLALTLLSVATGCAGPTTPLGAPIATSSHEIKFNTLSKLTTVFENSATKIELNPNQQILHRRGNLSFTISDPNGVHSNYDIIVKYNGIDITQSFLKYAHIERNNKLIKVDANKIYLDPNKDHIIEVIYGGSGITAFRSKALGYAKLEPAQCSAFHDEKIHTLDGMQVHPNILQVIGLESAKHNFNPALIAAIIAQESKFNPNAVSVAKAVGLTQIIPSTAREIASSHDNYPVSQELVSSSSILIKMLISLGKVTGEQDFRLDPQKSVKGAVEYLASLQSQLIKSGVKARVDQYSSNPEVEMTKLLLASYHSGLLRTVTEHERNGSLWLQSSELKAAKRYVNLVNSYCGQFTNPNNRNTSLNNLLEEILYAYETSNL